MSNDAHLRRVTVEIWNFASRKVLEVDIVHFLRLTSIRFVWAVARPQVLWMRSESDIEHVKGHTALLLVLKINHCTENLSRRVEGTTPST